MQKFQRFFKISKVDKEKRMVYGYATTKDMDSDGEIITLDAVKKALPAYMMYPTIREMHQPKSVGTTKSAEMDKKGLYIGAKVVEDNAWKFVQEGIYKGFSIGGNVIQRVGNVIKELELVEISLVDVPANKHAKIDIWKKEKMQKDAIGVHCAVNLMDACQQMIWDLEVRGKDTKKVKKMLEEIKKLVADEAMEPEMKKEDLKLVDLPEIELLKLQIKSLEKLDCGDNQLADAIRKGAIMSKKAQLEKAEKDEKEVTPVTPEVEDEETETEEVEEEDTDTEEETETEEVETPTEDGEPTPETKQTGASVNLKKLDDIGKKISAVKPQEKKVEKVSADSKILIKGMNTLISKMSEMADVVVSMDARLKKVEGTPAAAKSKSAVVYKSAEDKKEKQPSVDPQSPLGVKKARLAELEKMFDDMGPAAFAKAGHSTEAMKLQEEVRILSLQS